jgi:hypothetical protein
LYFMAQSYWGAASGIKAGLRHALCMYLIRHASAVQLRRPL